MFIRKILEFPAIYDWFQEIVGGVKGREFFVENHIKPQSGQSVLDIGCGTGDMIKFFPEVEYYGVDPSSAYIEKANARNVPNSYFKSEILTLDKLKNHNYYDIVHSTGVLHHINDDQAIELMQVSAKALKAGKSFFTLDGCFYPQQSFVEKTMLNLDRGKYMRDEAAYVKLAKSVFKEVKSYLYPDLFKPLPYPVVIIEMKN